MRAKTWLLPDGIQDVLPDAACRLEVLRRHLLDLFGSWGYELVFPPLVEYVESLLTGASHDLDLMTFKITDQLTGRLMGIRADTTPQVARLDAHCVPHSHTARYCYSSTVLSTLPSALSTSRSPIQIGAELYGYSGIAADIEIIRLMLTTLQHAGLQKVHLDIGHVAIFRALAQAAQLSNILENQLFDIYQRKSLPELHALAKNLPCATWFVALGELSGDVSVLAKAQTALSDAPDLVLQAIADIEAVVAALAGFDAVLTLSIDLSELRGYHYHTGLVFAAYSNGTAAEIAKGGRYDCVGAAFGRARAATGFSADLKTLLSTFAAPIVLKKVFAPALPASNLLQKIVQLRAQGYVVIQGLVGDNTTAQQLGCAWQLVPHQEDWHLEAITT